MHNDAKTRLKPGDPGYVGRGHPPKHGQVKPKEVRNPWGRKGKGKSEEAEVDFSARMAKLLAKPVRTKDGTEHSQDEIAHNALLKKVAEGNINAIKYFHQLRQQYTPKPTATELELLSAETRERLIAEAIKRRAAREASGVNATDPAKDDMETAEEAEPRYRGDGNNAHSDL